MSRVLTCPWSLSLVPGPWSLSLSLSLSLVPGPVSGPWSLPHSSCLSRLCRSVTQLIRWADQVILQGVVRHTEEEATPSVTTVIRAVLDGVKVWLSCSFSWSY